MSVDTSRATAIAERLNALSRGAVPGSGIGTPEPEPQTVPGSQNRPGTENHDAVKVGTSKSSDDFDVTVPGSEPSMPEPGTASEKPLYEDIRGMLDGTLPDPPEPRLGRRTDNRCLFYASQVNWVFGDPESGKTWLCLAATVEALQAGRRALIVDLDHNGAAATVRRLLDLGAPIEALRDINRFRYCEPEDRLELRQVILDCAAWRPAVALVDSIGELLPMYGASSNSSDDFTLAHSNVLKPLARAGAAVLAVDHLAKGADSRAAGPGGTAAKRRAIGGVSLRVKVKQPFTPGHGGSATLLVNKDRHGSVRAHCPVGDREPVAGTFKLLAFTDGVLEWAIYPPADGERNSDENAPPDDVAAIQALDPPPTTVDDARSRLKWNKQRTATALRTWREQRGEQ